MSVRARRRASTAVVLSLAAAAVLAACGTSSPSASSGGGSSTSLPASSVPSSPASGGGAAVPTSCNALPSSLIAPYIGSGYTVVPIPSHHFTCEYANMTAKNVLIINMGGGTVTPAQFASLETRTRQTGVTVTSISGLGAEAFTISKGGMPSGVESLTSSGQLFVVSSNLPFAKTESLISQLEARY